MSAWSDAQSSGTLLTKHCYADGVSWSYVVAGLCENDSTTPITFTPELISEIFTTFGADMRDVAATNDMPIEFLTAAIALVAERVGTANAATHVDYMTGFISEEDTPELAYAGSTGLRFDHVRNIRGPILIADYIASPITAIATAASHMLAVMEFTRFQPPMVASAYNTDTSGGYDATSRWRMINPTQIDRYLGWWNAAVKAITIDGSLADGAPTFTHLLLQIVAPVPVLPQTFSGQQFNKPESNAAVDAGMMTVCDHNQNLATIWPLDKATQERITNVATAASSGLGLPFGMSSWSYPDRGGTMREMNSEEVQNLFRAMRDYVAGIYEYDQGRRPSLPGQPVYMP